MIAIICIALSGAAFYVSLGLGENWPLAWVAPIPILWRAFGRAGWASSFAAALAASALGGANLIPAYAEILPPAALALAVATPAFMFAAAVSCGRIAFRRFGVFAGVTTFAASWVGLDFALSLEPSSGGALTPAASQVAAPMLIQTASLVGAAGVVFLLGVVSATFAAAIRLRSVSLCVAAAALFAANAAYGAWRLSTGTVNSLRVALIVSDSAVGEVWKSDETAARRVIDAYAREARRLSSSGFDLIVTPENIARIDPAWRESAIAPLGRAASETGAMIVAGFNTHLEGAPRNVAWVFEPKGGAHYYIKRQLVPGLETTRYVPGDGPLVAGDGVMTAVCKDLDFASMIREDVASGGVKIIAAPAWDFRKDGWSHARIAILRGVENGVAIARSAREGHLTLSDPFGRVIIAGVSTDNFKTLTGDVSLGGSPTLYNRYGDVFAYLCLAFGIAMPIAAATRRAARD